MVDTVVDIIDKAFDTNQRSVDFLQWLIICLVIAGIAFGILACYISGLLAVVEILIAPALIWAIRSYTSVNKDNVSILNGATKTLNGARSQAQIQRKIRKEIEIERRRGG